MKIKLIFVYFYCIIFSISSFANDSVASVAGMQDSTAVDSSVVVEKRMTVQQPINQKQQVNQPATTTASSQSSSFLNNVLFFLFGLLLGALGLVIFSKYKIDKILYYEKHSLLKKLKKQGKFTFLNYFAMVEQLRKEHDKKRVRVKFLEGKITLMEKDNTDSEYENDALETAADVNETYDSDAYKSEKQDKKEIFWETAGEQKKVITEIYFTIPFENGSFLDLHKSEVKEPNDFYKIIFKEGDLGELHFLTGEFDKTSIDNISGYLSPVCDIKNIEKRLSATKIRMNSPGEVVLKDGYWMINNNKKVQIELI